MNINPTEITNFDRTRSELEIFWIFCICVAGKNSDYAARCVNKMLKRTHYPFAKLKGELAASDTAIYNMLVANKVGQYHRIEKAIRQSLNLDMETVTLSDLMSIHGVGPKTARFFLLHSRRDCEYAVLDTHILRWLREKCGFKGCPKATPWKMEVYDHWQSVFISVAKNTFGDLPLAEIDLLVWTLMSGRLSDEIL